MSVPLALLDVLAQIPDPRDPRGARHPLSAALALAALAILTGCKSYEAIAQFGRDKGGALAHALGFRRGKAPCKSTLSELFRALDIDAFEAALARWVASRLAPDTAPVVSLDGKTLRGSRDGETPPVSPRPSAGSPIALARLWSFSACRSLNNRTALIGMGHSAFGSGWPGARSEPPATRSTPPNSPDGRGVSRLASAEWVGDG
jgi:hypothetical protein